jgi:hypothetical protein
MTHSILRRRIQSLLTHSTYSVFEKEFVSNIKKVNRDSYFKPPSEALYSVINAIFLQCIDPAPPRKDTHRGKSRGPILEAALEDRNRVGTK